MKADDRAGLHPGSKNNAGVCLRNQGKSARGIALTLATGPAYVTICKSVKRFAKLAVAVGLLAGLSTLAFVNSAGSTRAQLERISALSDPASLPLSRGYNDYVQCCSLADGTEAGVVKFADGQTARYWFRSHHLTNDIGGTLFLLSDNTRLYLAGWFCCEVQLPERQLLSSAHLREFVRDHQGVAP